METHPTQSPRTYLLVYLALILLLGATIGASYFNLGALNLIIALAISIAKGLLVAYFFMHLRTSGTLIRLFALIGFLFLAILIGLTFADYLTRM